MSESETSARGFSRHAKELARVLRMFGASHGQQVRSATLQSLWVRHVIRPSFEDLDAAVAELIDARLLLRGRPDGVVMTEGAAGLR